MSITNNNTSNPYSSVSDLLSNVRNFKIIESTLREGEQFSNAFFSTETKIKLYDQGGPQPFVLLLADTTLSIVRLCCMTPIESSYSTKSN